LQQPVLQHFCLPLQQAFVCALTGDAAKLAARVAISRRYFIESSLEFRIELGRASYACRAVVQENSARGGGTGGRCERAVTRSSITKVVLLTSASAANALALPK